VIEVITDKIKKQNKKAKLKRQKTKVGILMPTDKLYYLIYNTIIILPLIQYYLVHNTIIL